LGLGALQAAEESGVFNRAKYLSAVSGGSYIATAFVAARALGTDEGDEAAKPWARGSGEEAHLRRNLSYLGEDLPDRLLALVYYVIRTVFHLVQFLAGLLLIGAILGGLYRESGILDMAGSTLDAGHRVSRGFAIIGVLSIGGLVDASRGYHGRDVATASGVHRMWFSARERAYTLRVQVRRAVILLVLALILPDLIAAASRVLASTNFEKSKDFAWLGIAVLAFAAVASFVLRSQKSTARRLPYRVILRAGRAIFSVAMIILTVSPVLSAIGWQAGLSLRSNIMFAATAGAILVLYGLFVHANWTSMHHLYARRLTRAYIVIEPERLGLEPGCGTQRHHRRLDQIALGCLSSNRVPELLVCAAINVGRGESAQGEGSGSFVFSPSHVGAPIFAKQLSFLSSRPCSDVVAASGAAVAPNMGRLTRNSVRALLALLNLRLGLWVSVPQSSGKHDTRESSIGRTGERSETRGSTTDNREPATGNMAVSETDARATGCMSGEPGACIGSGECARLKAGRDQRKGPIQGLRDGWKEPGPYWTWRELLGELSARDGALFISDGGHWDNSGIIELMRRGCRTIFAVDAAVDEPRLGNLVRAVSLARSELGVEINMSGVMLDRNEPVMRMTFSYPGEDATAPPNQLIVMRTFIADFMPADLVAMSRADGTHGLGSVFPRHVTLNQFLQARDVDGYITLGRWLFSEAVAVADLRPAIEADSEQD
jgi:hypothetical protein